MSPKDSKIIATNPGATPYDLHTQFGLSKGGFNELIARQDTEADNVLKAGKPTLRPDISKSLPAMPNTMPHLQPSNEQVRLISKGGSGHGALVDRQQAEKMIRKYPNDYTIA